MQTSVQSHALRIGDAAPNATLATADGKTVELASFWMDTPNGALVVFLRNFGCLFCREQAKRLRDAYPELTKRRINVVAVGVGTPSNAAEFATWLKLPFPVFGCPDTSIHAAWGLGRATAGSMLDPGLVAAGARALLGGNIQSKPTGDSRQLPGMFIVDQQGSVRWARPGRHSGDNPTNEELLEAIDAVLTGTIEPGVADS